MAAIVDDIYYGCKTKYVKKCVKHGIKIIPNTSIKVCNEYQYNIGFMSYVMSFCHGMSYHVIVIN